MEKIALTKPKLSSDELDRMLCDDTTESVSKDTAVSSTFVSMDTNSSGDSVSKDTPLTELPVSNDTISDDAPVSKDIFDVEDVSGAYIDLRAKMTSLYGEGEDEIGNPSEDYYSTVWYGENDTAVRLLVRSNSQYEGFSIRLVYGKTNSDGYVEYLEELARQEQIQEEQSNRSESTDGL